jgi:hypothetical protein
MRHNASRIFTDKELVDLTASVSLMNALTRMRIALGEKFKDLNRFEGVRGRGTGQHLSAPPVGHGLQERFVGPRQRWIATLQGLRNEPRQFLSHAHARSRCLAMTQCHNTIRHCDKFKADQADGRRGGNGRSHRCRRAASDQQLDCGHGLVASRERRPRRHGRCTSGPGV